MRRLHLGRRAVRRQARTFFSMAHTPILMGTLEPLLQFGACGAGAGGVRARGGAGFRAGHQEMLGGGQRRRSGDGELRHAAARRAREGRCMAPDAHA